MADNVAITPGTGATIAADDIGGVLYQRVKISVGADGAGADLAPGSAAAAASLPVALSTEDAARIGATNEAAAASDTATSGAIGLLKRIAQRVTSLIALLPAAIGPTAKAGALSVTTATDDPVVTLMGGVTETAPASDTASSGHNGRLQRIAQRLTSLIALLPTALGQGTMATSMKVVIASDQSSLSISENASATIGTGATTSRINAAASLNLTSVKAGAAKLFGWHIDNLSASTIYVKFYNKASAPVVASDTPAFTVTIAANTTSKHALTQGIAFPLGLAYAITGALTDTDTTNVLAPSGQGTIQWI